MEAYFEVLEDIYRLVAVYITQQAVETTLIATLFVGIVCMCVLALWEVRKSGETTMTIDYFKRHVQLSKREKKIVVDMAEDYLEEQILRRKLKREVARQIYEKLGKAFDIEELIPAGDVKGRLKAIRKHMNGHKQPIKIPGPAPIQDIQPKRSAKERASKFFKPATT